MDKIVIVSDDWEGDFEEYLNLSNVSHNDKMVLTSKILTRKQVLQCAHDIAFSVLHIFENKYPSDMSIRNLLEALQKYIIEDLPIDENIANIAYKSKATASKDGNDAAAYAAFAAFVASEGCVSSYIVSLSFLVYETTKNALAAQNHEQIQIIKNIYRKG